MVVADLNSCPFLFHLVSNNALLGTISFLRMPAKIRTEACCSQVKRSVRLQAGLGDNIVHSQKWQQSFVCTLVNTEMEILGTYGYTILKKKTKTINGQFLAN